MRRLVLLFLATLSFARAAAPEALLVLVGDQHSAYERTAQFVARVDRLQAEHPRVPLAILINGDSLEYGNLVARRTAGAIDFAMFRALAARAPTIINLGNHEPEFYDVAETVRRLRATGLTVISNLRSRGTGELFAPPSTRLTLGAHELVLAGVTTDQLNTYRLAIRPELDLTDPTVWAREKFPALFAAPHNSPGSARSPLPVVLSHSGVRADRAMFAHVPPGTLFAGAHDHLRFVHRDARVTYVHSGSWMDYVSVARLVREESGLRWEITQEPLPADAPADPALADLVRTTLAQHLTAEETKVVGRTPRALAPSDAANFAVEAARHAAHADVAVIGATTFGAGLPAGDITRFAFDACVRFDGTLFAAEVDGAWLRALLARANQGPDTPFAQRTGENLIAAVADEITPGRTYRLVTSDWIAKNPAKYLGEKPPALRELPDLKLKAAVLRALSP